MIDIIFAAAESAGHGVSGAGGRFDVAVIMAFLSVGLSTGLIATGVFFVFAGTLGVLRLPDFFSRIHAAGMTDTLGVELILLGLMIQAGLSLLSLKFLLVAFFLLLTSPTATHAMANAAYHGGLKPKLGRYKSPDIDTLRRGGEAK